MNRLNSRAGIVTIALLSILTASLAAVVAVDSGGGPATAASTTETHTITVSGEGTGMGVPDTLIASLTVHSRQGSAQAALDGVQVGMNRVKSTLTGKGVKASDLQTTDLELDPAYDDHSHVIGYDASESMSVRIFPLKHSGNVLSAVTGAAGNSVSFDGISLDISDKSKALNDARANAFKQAQEAAQTDATLAGEHLGKVMSIKESTEASTQPQPYAADGLAFATAKALPIQAGKQAVTVTLDVVWSLD
ncbi:MAG TPA: SIMPL domain-containing protein [Mycobacteriales bacterium]|nr:SIMPL domain-containing protein [Mycobacteriales bacterium]